VLLKPVSVTQLGALADRLRRGTGRLGPADEPPASPRTS
jgi:hypothetical protein